MGYQRRVHGDSLSFFGRRNIKMKAVALFSLIAVAFAEPEAEAKPYYYGAYGLGYSGYYYGKREAEAEPKADADPYLLYGGYAGYPYAHHSVYYGKREAEAEAKPYYYGAYGLGYGGLYGHGLGYGYGHSVYYGKREAEAEAKPYYYGGYGYARPYYGGYSGYGRGYYWG